MKTRWTRRGIFAMLLLAIACVYFFVQKEMTVFYVLLGIICVTVLAVIIVFYRALAKAGAIKEIREGMREDIELKKERRRDAKEFNREMRKLDLIEAKYSIRVESIESKMDQLLAKIESYGDELSQSEREAIRSEYEQLERELKEIDKEAEEEYHKMSRTK